MPRTLKDVAHAEIFRCNVDGKDLICQKLAKDYHVYNVQNEALISTSWFICRVKFELINNAWHFANERILSLTEKTEIIQGYAKIIWCD